VEYVLGVVAAVLIGTGFVLQQKAAEQAPQAGLLQARLMLGLLRDRTWLAGLAGRAGGYLRA
jgi:hypothetical protein